MSIDNYSHLPKDTLVICHYTSVNQTPVDSPTTLDTMRKYEARYGAYPLPFTVKQGETYGGASQSIRL